MQGEVIHGEPLDVGHTLLVRKADSDLVVKVTNEIGEKNENLDYFPLWWNLSAAMPSSFELAKFLLSSKISVGHRVSSTQWLQYSPFEHICPPVLIWHYESLRPRPNAPPSPEERVLIIIFIFKK